MKNGVSYRERMEEVQEKSFITCAGLIYTTGKAKFGYIRKKGFHMEIWVNDLVWGFGIYAPNRSVGIVK